MSRKIVANENSFPVDELIDALEEMRGSKEKRIAFEEFYKSYVINSSEIIISNQSDILKKYVEETEVFSLLIKDKSNDFDEIAKEIYAMGRFVGAHDAFMTWCKMYFDKTEYERVMNKVLSKKHVPEILECVRESPGIQNKKILERVKIKPNHLSELTKEMIYYQIISRFSVGKNTFYELTPRAKEFFKRKKKAKVIRPKMYRYNEILEKSLRNAGVYKTLVFELSENNKSIATIKEYSQEMDNYRRI